MRNEARKNNKSLWEKSMRLVIDITKVSAISLAEKSLGTKSPAPRRLPPLAAKASFVVPYFPESRRSQEPERVPNPPSFLLELPAEEIFMINEEVTTNVEEPESVPNPPSFLLELQPEEIFMINEEVPTNVDGRASDYIKWFHERVKKE